MTLKKLKKVLQKLILFWINSTKKIIVLRNKISDFNLIILIFIRQCLKGISLIVKFNPVFDEIFFSSILWVCHLKSDKLLETIFEKHKSLFHQNLKITKRMLITILQDSAWLFFIHLEFFTYFGSANNQDYVNWSNIIQIKYRKIKAILPIQSLFFSWNCWGHQQINCYMQYYYDSYICK